MQPIFLLFGTDGCHLCDDAQLLITELLQQYAHLTVEYIDIAEQEQWQEKYALRIPLVLQEQSGAELGWPFDAQALLAFVQPYLNSSEV